MECIWKQRRLEKGKVFCTYSSDIIFLPNGSLGPFLISGTGKHSEILQLRSFTENLNVNYKLPRKYSIND